MAEHEGKMQKSHEEVDQKRHLRHQEPQPLFEQFHAWEQGLLPFNETPFEPRMDQHSAMLLSIRSDEGRANLALHLQQTYGNRYVQRLVESVGVQPKLTVNAPDDVYEQEADRVAGTVTRAMAAQAQRRAEEEEEEEETELQTRSLLQRQEEDEEEEVQTQPAESRPVQNECLPTETIQRNNMSFEEKKELFERFAEEQKEHREQWERPARREPGPVAQPPVAREYPPEVVQQAMDYMARLPFNPESDKGRQYMEAHPPPVNPEVLFEIAGQVGPVVQPPVAREYPPEVVQQAMDYMARLPFNPESDKGRQYMEAHPPPVNPEVLFEIAGQVGPVVQPSVQGPEEEEEAIQTSPTDRIQPTATNEVLEVDREIESGINAARGGGQPLPEEARHPMEQAFGADFSDVRVHTDSEADALNQQLSAKAFTTGQDVFFREGEYNTSSDSGRKLIAHELTHVVQQAGAHADNIQPPEVSRVSPLGVQRDLVPEAEQAFKTAITQNSGYEDFKNWTDDYMPVSHQEELVDISGKKKARSAKDALKDFIRAFLLAEYASRIKENYFEYTITKTTLTDEERETLKKKYLPKALQMRDKYKGLLAKGVAAPETQSFMDAAGFAGAIAVTEEQKKKVAKGPRIDVRSTYWTSVQKFMGFHLFIVYTSAEGKQWYFRGGPEHTDGDPGDVVGDMGEYVPGVDDWDPSAPSKTVLKGPKAAEKLDALIEATLAIESMEVPYVASKFKTTKLKLSGENCNAAAWTILDRAGIPKGKPSGLHLGWGHQLGKFLGEGVEVEPEEEGGEGEPRVISGGGKEVAVYRDRKGWEKVGTLPDGAPVSALDVDEGMMKIRHADGLIGWVDLAKVQKPREKGRPFRIAGEEGQLIATFSADPMSATPPVEGGQLVEVLDPDFTIGESENAFVRIRYQIDEDEFESRVFGKDLVETQDQIVIEKLRMFENAGKRFDDYHCQVAGVTAKELAEVTKDGRQKLVEMLGIDETHLDHVIAELTKQEIPGTPCKIVGEMPQVPIFTEDSMQMIARLSPGTPVESLGPDPENKNLVIIRFTHEGEERTGRTPEDFVKKVGEEEETSTEAEAEEEAPRERVKPEIPSKENRPPAKTLK